MLFVCFRLNIEQNLACFTVCRFWETLSNLMLQVILTEVIPVLINRFVGSWSWVRWFFFYRPGLGVRIVRHLPLTFSFPCEQWCIKVRKIFFRGVFIDGWIEFSFDATAADSESATQDNIRSVANITIRTKNSFIVFKLDYSRFL